MKRGRVLALALVLLVACKATTPMDDGPSAARRDPIDASVVSTVDAAIAVPPSPAPEEGPLAWGTRPAKEGVLFPIVDGMCIHGRIFPLSNGPLFTYGSAAGAWMRGGATTAALVGEKGLDPQDALGFGSVFAFFAATSIGGHYPDHLWAVIEVSSRMVEASEVRAGNATQTSWPVVLESGVSFGEAGNAPTPGTAVRHHGRPIVLEDGSALIPESASKQDATTYSFRAIDANGALVAGAKVPGADLAKLAMNGPVVRLASGEVLGLRTDPTTKLVRWSPAKPVDDLAVTGPRGDAALVSGKARAFVQLGVQLLVYDGEKLAPAKLSARLTKGFAWTASADDTLYVALPDKTLLTETAAGQSTEEPMPAFGKLHAAGSELWLVAPEGKLFRKRSGPWEAVPLPPPPFGNTLRGPLTIESIQSVGPGDVFVNARRFEKGWGWKDPEPYRVLYRTKRPAQVLRCQDVRNEGTGTGMYAWPPAADDACTTPFVVVMREEVKPLPKDYPNIAARLRGKTEYGDTLTFLNFDGRKSKNLGIVMTDTDKARKLATYLSKSLDLRADVVCGRPVAERALSFDVAKGTFSGGAGLPR